MSDRGQGARPAQTLSDTGRYNVVAIGKRDYYQVAIALLEAGRLGRLITDFYTPDRLRRRLGKRWDAALTSKRTVSFWPSALLSKALPATRHNRARMRYVDDLFGFVAAMITFFTGNRAVVYSYFLHGFVSFYRLIGRTPQDLICFQVHPSPWFINHLMAEDGAAFAGQGRIAFLEDIEAAFTDADMENYKRALRYCRCVITASGVTWRSIADATDVPVVVAPYGSKIAGLTTGCARHTPSAGAKIKLLTVCQLVQRKGMHWAFDAMRSLPDTIRERFEWTVVANFQDPAIRALAPDNVVFRTGLSDNELGDAMRAADLFVMPSVLEGFGLVYIEALSAGTPIVYTRNTGPADFCTHGVHGFSVDCSRLEPLAELFTSLAESPAQLHNMREACAAKAAELSWQAFRAQILLSLPGHDAVI